MKRLKTGVFLVVFYTAAITSYAQKTPEPILQPKESRIEKPRLFAALPPKTAISKTILDDIFSGRKTQVSIPVSNGIPFEGRIIEMVQKNPNLVSINIRLSNYDSSLLNISRITESDLSVSYTGRLINIRSGDILLLQKENDRFYFTREPQSLVMVE